MTLISTDFVTVRPRESVTVTLYVSVPDSLRTALVALDAVLESPGPLIE